jgi:RimJ/RimL family protein N-acetyltransferase
VTRLRRVEAADAPFLESERDGADAAGEFAWFGYRDPGRITQQIESMTTITSDNGTLVITDDDDLAVGSFGWRKSRNGPPPFGECWNVGIWIAPEHRGKGHGTEAQRLGAAYLFDHTLMERVEASTEADNIAEQRALEKAGFVREGVLRRACFRSGSWRDMVMFSKLRGEK